jgi:hypothetical protein
LPGGGGATDSGRPPSYYIAEILPETNDFQRALLQDGELTRDEYEAAIFATVQCVADNGFVVAGPNYDSMGYLVYQFATKDTALGGQFSLVSDSCSSQYSRDVSVIWSSVLRQSLPPPAVDPDVADAMARAAWAQCLEAHGVPEIGDAPSFDDLRAAVQAAGVPGSLLVDCEWEYAASQGHPRPKDTE